MSVDFLIETAKKIQVVINDNSSEIEKLDQEIGDGDHIFNVQRGIKLVIELEPIIKDLIKTKTSEREHRIIDSDENSSMETKKEDGYF